MAVTEILAKIIGTALGFAYAGFLLMLFTFPLWWVLAVDLGWY
jgi:hypothetical protein